jgi:membrane associated rhomboid family serine protease
MRYGGSGYTTSIGLPGFPPAVKWLLIINTAVFFLHFFASISGLGQFFDVFALTPAFVLHGAIWQLATYTFLHGGIGHILWNMLPLWMFGAELEKTWGTRAFLKYYFLCGVGAGVCVVLANYLLPSGEPRASTIGASGAVYGVLLAFGVLFPRTRILFFFLFPIEARFFVAIVGAIAFLSTLSSGAGSPVSHIAHLGGMIFGYFYLKSALMTRASAAYGHRYNYGPAAAPRRPAKRLSVALRDRYKEWKMQRARRKFEVYLRKRQERDRDRDRYVH